MQLFLRLYMLTFTDILLPKWRERQKEGKWRRKERGGERKNQKENTLVLPKSPVAPSPSITCMPSEVPPCPYFILCLTLDLFLGFDMAFHFFFFFFSPLMTLIRIVLFLDANFKNYVTFPRILSTILLMEQSKCSKPK